jgi:uncharacterized protein YutE (UPF0331/DUF86 family)
VTQPIQLTLIGKPGCHLCDDAQVVIDSVLSEFDTEIPVEKKNILDDDALFARFSEEIPVLLINDKVHNYWHIDPVRLREALQKLL